MYTYHSLCEVCDVCTSLSMYSVKGYEDWMMNIWCVCVCVCVTDHMFWHYLLVKLYTYSNMTYSNTRSIRGFKRHFFGDIFIYLSMGWMYRGESGISSPIYLMTKTRTGELLHIWTAKLPMDLKLHLYNYCSTVCSMSY